MKRFQTATLVVLVVLFCFSPNEGRAQYSIPNFSISINPLGFAQFGPVVNAEIRLKKDLALNLHGRIPSLGPLSYVARQDEMDPLDRLEGYAVGVGLQKFFGEKFSKRYVGLLFDYEQTTGTYILEQPDEWTEDNDIIIVHGNAGYRLRLFDEFYLNLGGSLGVAFVNWEWQYSELALQGTETEPMGSNLYPFGMLDFAFGFEF